jgi:acetoin utilization deacetylase AcuC-like enzyme
MATALISHPDCRLHDMGSHHPECPRRVDAINDLLLSLRVLDMLLMFDAPRVSREQLERVHDSAYLDWLEEILPDKGFTCIDMDTGMNTKTLRAARRAAGALILATDLVATSRADNAFCNVRPPGHHATADTAMGFCFYNNVALGVAHALSVHNMERVAVLDFDVHHGNGTDLIFMHDPRVLVCSLYQQGLFPFSEGEDHHVGGIDVALPEGSGGSEMRRAVEDAWLPALDEFRPDMVFVSAGFDAHAHDDISDLLFSDADFAWLSELVLSVADRHAGGRLVSTLEGGYDLDSLARCAAAHVKTLAGL